MVEYLRREEISQYDLLNSTSSLERRIPLQMLQRQTAWLYTSIQRLRGVALNPSVI